ncbi:MAG TPA: hypothetical protein VIJ66_03790 [Solirubrobacteraceae bacterium]
MTNPFTYDRPLPPRDLIDREQELALLASLADAGQSARLSGPRRYGKTTLIGRLAQTMREDHDFAVAYVDLSRITGIDDIAQRIEAAYDTAFTGGLRSAWHALRRRADPSATLGVPGVVSVGLRSSASHADSLARLHSLLEAPRRLHERTGRRCLVAYDEFQEMLTAQPDLDGVLRSHIQHHSGAVSYLFAGSHAGMMDALFGDRRRPLFEQARAVRIGALAGADIADYVEARFSAAHRALDSDVADSLATLASGHPQRAMMIAHFLWERSAHGEDEAGLLAAHQIALAEASDGLQRTWDSLSANQRKLVGVLAAGHSHPLRVTALEHAGLAKSSLVDARDKLTAQGDLFVHAGGLVELTDPFLAAWVLHGTPRR